MQLCLPSSAADTFTKDKGTIPLSGTRLFLPSIAGYQHAWIVGLCLVFVPTRNVIGNDGKNHQHRLGDWVVDVIAAETGSAEEGVVLEAVPARCHRLHSGFREIGYATFLLLDEEIQCWFSMAPSVL